MRVQLNRSVIQLLYELREEAAPLRAALEAIRQNPDHPDTVRDETRPGRRELFVRVGMRDYWIGYEVDRSGGETVIVVGAIQENK